MVRDSMTLHELALQKKMPKHQFMDRPTLQWIVETGQSRFGTLVPKLKFSPLVQPNLFLARPSETFITEKAIANGIHGFRHCARVSLLAAQVYAMSTKNPRLDILRMIMVVGSLHDCRRINDNADEGHGSRAAEWLLNNQSPVQEWFKVADLGVYL